MEFIEEVSPETACSVAHTTADYDTAALAFAKGASQVTHLYNAMPPFLHREPGVVGAAFDAAHVSVELITDGVHLHPSVVRASFRLYGDDRVILVSDSMMATGLEDGSYELGGLPVTVSGNTARLTEGGAIAGSVTNIMNCLRMAVRMGIPLHAAVKAATVNPAKAIGLYGDLGSIEAGKMADLALLGEGLEVRGVYLRGGRIR
jgi:N-acetylglucosamine-6-phosphate deacetylase